MLVHHFYISKTADVEIQGGSCIITSGVTLHLGAPGKKYEKAFLHNHIKRSFEDKLFSSG